MNAFTSPLPEIMLASQIAAICLLTVLKRASEIYLNNIWVLVSISEMK